MLSIKGNGLPVSVLFSQAATFIFDILLLRGHVSEDRWLQLFHDVIHELWSLLYETTRLSMISKAPAKYDLTAKLNHETKITLECVLFITRKEKQATFPQVQKLFVPCTSFKRSLTCFPSWLSKQTLCKWLGSCGTDMKCIVFHRNLRKPEAQFCLLTLLS